MKKALVFIVLLTMLFPAGSGASQAVNPQNMGDGSLVEAVPGGMPPRPFPENPIPHHEPGQPSRAGQYSTQVSGIDAQGVEQSYTLSGLDALLADGTLPDPLAGNYRLVDLDKIMLGWQPNLDDFAFQSFTLTPTLGAITGSLQAPGDYWASDIAAGDLNGDGQDEQIAAYVDQLGAIYLTRGEMPGVETKVHAAPAAVAYGDGTGDLLVRGYDEALWQLHYDGVSWGSWVQAGGMLLSAPAAVSTGTGEFDVYAIGSDNLTYRVHYDGANYGAWELVDVAGYWPEIEWTASIVEVDAPAVVAHSAGRIELFRRGPDNTLRWRHFDGSSWGDWSSLGGFLSSAPAAFALDGGGVLRVMGRGLDGMIWHRIYSGTTWGGWERLALPDGLTAASAPSVATSPEGQSILFVRGSDNAAWQNPYMGDGWGAWSSAGGELGSAVAAMLWNDQTILFAQQIDHRLQVSLDGAAWTSFTNPPAQKPYSSGAFTLPPGDPETTLENFSITLETGYFTGAGSQQLIMAYRTAADQYRLELRGNRDGFLSYLLAEVDHPTTCYNARIAAGDVDGDGIDDIALVCVTGWYHYQVSIYQAQVDENGDWSLVLVEDSPFIYTNDHLFSGTLRIASGDLNGDLQDEIVVLSDWWLADYYLYYYTQLYIFDIDDPTGTPAMQREISQAFFIENHTGLALGVGDVNLDAVDEIVLTWPTGFGPYPWMHRELQILDARGYPAEPPSVLAAYTISSISDLTFLDTLAIGDLDRDVLQEIAFLGDADYNGISLRVYELQLDQVPPVIAPIADLRLLTDGDWIRYPRLVAGDFTGESLRVGPPSFRRQVDTGGITVLLNEPPKHIDTLDGVTYDINSSDLDTYASYENEQSQGTEMSLQVRRDWGFAAGLDWGVGNPKGTHVKNSIDLSYGGHFEKTTTEFTQIDFGENVKATSDDIVIYTGQSLDVWEYPAYEDDSGLPAGRIMVVFPAPGLSNYGAQQYFETGNSSCDFWYAPEHQLNNVWSYAASDDQLKDFNGEILNQLQTVTVGPTENELWTHWSTLTETQQANACSLGVDRMFEWQIGGDAIRLQYAPAGIGASFEVFLPYMKGTLENSYSLGSLSTKTVFGSEDTTVRINFDAIDPSGQYNYEVTPYLYWAKEGYLVLDYLTEPKNTSFWLKYDRPDPAFILPWASGQCPGKQLFSKDIQISPPFAVNGETVAITATLHNFSNLPVNNVPVRFYLGDPAQNEQIGGDQLVDLPARGRVDVPVTWVAEGSLQQRIYVVIDPDHEILEMHDETTNPEKDNNLGFGVVAMGNSGYLDPGGQVYFDYQHLTYTDTQDLPASVYVPTAAVTETLRLEMTPLMPGGRVRRGFDLSAYLGGSERGNPWQVTFEPMPAAVWIYYTDADLAGLDENTLTLYWYNDDAEAWEEAACGEYQRYPGDNYMIVPVCNVGSFAILSPYTPAFLPMVTK